MQDMGLTWAGGDTGGAGGGVRGGVNAGASASGSVIGGGSGGEGTLAGSAGERMGESPMVCGEVTASAIEALKPVDVIWVIDSSPSMGEEIEQVQRNLNDFTARITSSGLDLRVALIAAERDLATSDRDYIGVCIPPPLSTQDVCPDVDSERYRHVRLNVHSADPLERFVEGRPQLNGFLRPNALKHLVFVTDDDAGWGLDAQGFMALIEMDELLRGAYIHSVVDEIGYQSSCAFDDSCSCGDERGETYIQLSEQTSGIVFPICFNQGVNMASKAHWDQILQELDASGMGVRRYAVEKGLSKSSLYYHLKRRREEMESARVLTLSGGAVHELNLTTRQRCGLSCEIKQGSLTLSFDELPEAEWLGALIKALR